MTKLKSVADLANALLYKKDLEKSLARTGRPTEVIYCKKFRFTNKTGPLLVIGPIEKELRNELKQAHEGKEGRCVRNKAGGFEFVGKVSIDEFENATGFIGVVPATIVAEDKDEGTAAVDAMHEKRVERAIKQFPTAADDDEATGGAIGELFETEDDKQQKIEREKQLFSRFEKNFNSYETMQKSLTPDDRKALDKAMTDMIRRAEQKHAELFGSKHELTADDLDELIKVFDHIPRGLVPPQYKKELQDWRQTRDAMRDLAVDELMKNSSPAVAETMSTVLEAITAPTGLVTGVGELIGGEKFEKAKKVIERAAGAIDTLAKGIGILAKGKESLSSEQKTALEKRMADSETLDAIMEFADTAMELGSDFVPVLGTINNAKNVVVNAVATCARIDNAVRDGSLRDQALLDTASQLAKALGQSCSREKRLGAESGVKTATAALGVASDATLVGDAGALKIVNGVLKVGSKVVFMVADALSDTKASDMLKRARAGDEQAQQEVFAHHAHYAKFLLALAAKKGDPLARSFFLQRSLTEDDIAENSAEILMKFGLQESKETAVPQTIPEQIKEKLQKASDAASKVGAAVSNGVRSAIRLIKGDGGAQPAPVPKKEELGQLFTVKALQGMTAMLDVARKQKNAMGRAPAPAWLTANIENLEKGLGEANKPLRQYLGILINELAAAAQSDTPESQRKVVMIRAQREPLEEALRYLSDAGFA